MSVHFRFGWVDSGPSPDKLAQSTMAALRVDTDDGTVTATVNRRSGIYSNEIIVPLFNVAEWLVTNWWHIWYEVADTNEQPLEFESRHNLAFVGDGFVLPQLSITPASSRRMHLAWTRHKPQHARIEFLDEGYQNVEREELDAEFRGLIDAVLERLHADPETTVAADNLSRAWNAVNNLEADEVEFSRAAALLGVDPFDVRDDVADAIVAFWERTDASVREDALALANGAELHSIADWLNGAMGTVTRTRQGNDWSYIRGALRPADPGVEPWVRGYELARLTREHVGGNGGPIDLNRTGPLAIPRRQTHPPSTRIHGLVGTDTPACVTAPRSNSGTRFLQARALGDFLGRTTTGPGLLSSLATDRQAQSRAFAAEFLAPASSLRDRITIRRVDSEQVDDLGREYRVSTELIRRQIQNHDLAEIVAY